MRNLALSIVLALALAGCSEEEEVVVTPPSSTLAGSAMGALVVVIGAGGVGGWANQAGIGAGVSTT